MASKCVHLTLPDDEFCCPLCYDVFEKPKLLSSCAHSFCKTCLQKLVNFTSASEICCPVCRKISIVPENGVDEFATNTLLVRLIDNIPGRKEGIEVEKALTQCKIGMEKTRVVQGVIVEKLNKILENNRKAVDLKGKISQHANQMIDSIRKCEQKLCKKVDDSLEENCSTNFQKKLENLKQEYEEYMELTSAYVSTFEETLQKNDIGEIIDMNKRMVEQLNEFTTSTFSSCFALEEFDAVKELNLDFNKGFVIRDDFLGNLQETHHHNVQSTTANVRPRWNMQQQQPMLSMVPNMPSTRQVPWAHGQHQIAPRGVGFQFGMSQGVHGGNQCMQNAPIYQPVRMLGWAQMRPQYKFTQSTRNQPIGPGPIPTDQGMHIANPDPLLPRELAQASSQEAKRMLGERLFPLIQNTHPDLAGKITGMLLEIDNAELLHMLESHEALTAKVDEAVNVLKAHQTKNALAAERQKRNI